MSPILSPSKVCGQVRKLELPVDVFEFNAILELDRTGAALRYQVAMDLQQRATEYGDRRNDPTTKTGHCDLISTLEVS